VQCYATSKDGIAFDKPTLDVVEGTNIVQNDAIDGSTVWLDLDKGVPASERCVSSVTRFPFFRLACLSFG
jgi:hypothetical protein